MKSLVHVSDCLIVNQLNGVSVGCQYFLNLLCAFNGSGVLGDQQLGFKFAHQVDCLDPQQGISKSVKMEFQSKAIAIFLLLPKPKCVLMISLFHSKDGVYLLCVPLMA